MIRLSVISEGAAPREAPVSELPALLAAGLPTVWLDLESPTAEEAAVLLRDFRFHPVAVEDALVDTLHPKIDDYGDYLYVVLHGVMQDALTDDAKVDLQEIDFFLGSNFLVTHRDVASPSIASVRTRLEKQPGFTRGPDGLFAAIVEVMTDRYLPIIDAFDEKIDAMEDEVFEGAAGQEILGRVFAFKRSTLKLRRTIHPQREVIRNLSAGQYKIVGKDAQILLRDVYDHLFTIAELVETYRDLLSGTLEAHLSVTSNRLNVVMKRLTVITTMLMVIGTMAGIWGMNFDAIPFAHDPHGFSWMLASMTVAGLVTAGILRLLRWS